MVTTIETPKDDRVCECTHVQSNHVNNRGSCNSLTLAGNFCKCPRFKIKK